ncbi:arabinogalactan oligomer/maltooligosaccharide transport system substrate-binding protein [Virgibacillus natechei]|uniref:Arabinogalactan oligomer/maltooligosaccharide transport system substrate-binding protein n=1 Tax=Virgibacillus natechei TaxID=1216297 RepID=A0ABS4IEI1_9BACI|nr:extracellular solute-binding protein [Virgibacillus natechei]MBP1969355.1 arabinogalactan oligomer/maltooligosaccharide transport system substrate-binding protein [Virgibacillus natechei]UZD12501.1 extracellular solute-binding protein [Virgibacillus natechei]
MKKWIWMFIIVLFLGGLLVACGPDEADQSEEQAGENTGEMPEKPDALKLWVNAEENQEQAVEEITDKYTEETGIDVELTPIDMLDQIESLDVEGPAGNGPDVIFQPHDRIGDLVIRGLVDPIDLDDVESEYTDTSLEAVTYEGEYWGYPAVIETYTMFYNKSLVDSEPESMEDIMNIAESDTNASNDEFGFLMEADNFYYVYPFFAGYGSYVFANEDGNYDISDIGLDNEGAVEGGELVQSWYEDGYIPQDLTPDIMNGLFQEGKVSTVLNGPWMVRDFAEALGDDLGAVPMPVLDNGEHPNSFVGVKSYMMSYYSENKEWAQDLMAFITNKENSMHYYDVAGEMPPRDDALEDPVIADDEIFSAFAEQTEYGEPMPSDPAVQQIWDPINDALDFISRGETVDEVLTETVQTIHDQIEASGANQ